MNLCSFVHCQYGHLSDNDGYCEIKTVFPKSLKKQIRHRSRDSPFLVNWTEIGEAKLHRNCWDTLLRLYRRRTKKSSRNEPSMNDQEKVLIKEAAKTVEYFDGMETIACVAVNVAELIKKSKHSVCFTGAGISTSAGIGDYRGKSGKWTRQDQDKVTDTVQSVFNISPSDEPKAKKYKPGTDDEVDSDEEEVEEDGVNYEQLRPTYTHEALQKLMEMGLLKYMISQNGDGLHTLSQVLSEQISELHGNVFLEICEKCSERYERSYYVLDDNCSQYFEDMEEFGRTDIKKPSHAKQCSLCGLSHRTGRKCVKRRCKGYLVDSIINFKDNLQDDIYERAVDNATKSDLMLCLGTTLQVSPANELVEMTKDPKNIVICNRQKTPLDYLYIEKETSEAIPVYGSRIFGDCDIFMKEVMKNILLPEELKSWECARTERLILYESLRKN